MRILTILLSLSMANCSSIPKIKVEKKELVSLATIAGACVLGAAVGYATTPEGTKKSSHSLLFGSMAGLGGGLFAATFYEKPKTMEELVYINNMGLPENVRKDITDPYWRVYESNKTGKKLIRFYVPKMKHGSKNNVSLEVEGKDFEKRDELLETEINKIYTRGNTNESN